MPKSFNFADQNIEIYTKKGDIFLRRTYLWLTSSDVRIKNFVSVARVKPLSLIYIIRFCDDSIVNSNVKKSNAAFKKSHAISV